MNNGTEHYSFSRNKYLLIAPIELENGIDRKIDDTAMIFLLIQNRKQKHD